MSGARFLSVNADVTVTIGNEVIRVLGEGEKITVEFSCFSAGYKMMRNIGRLDKLRNRVADFSELLSSVGVSIVIRTPSRKLVTLGKGGRSALMKLLGLPNARLHLT